MDQPPDLEYLPRLIDDVIKDDMRLFGGVVITGPKWCGKTTTAEQIAETKVYLQNKVQFDRFSKIAMLDPSRVLEGNTPVLIDEWQKIPEL